MTMTILCIHSYAENVLEAPFLFKFIPPPWFLPLPLRILCIHHRPCLYNLKFVQCGCCTFPRRGNSNISEPPFLFYAMRVSVYVE